MIRTDDLSPQAQALIQFLESNRYICPWGSAWLDLYNLLPDTKEKTLFGDPPPLPMILTGWYVTSNLAKWLCIGEHIRWADQHSAIDKVDKYLRGLDPGVWHKWQDSPYVNGD